MLSPTASLRRGGFTDAWVAPGAAFTVGVAAGAPAIYRVNLGTVQVDPLPITLTSDWMAASFSRDGTRMALHGGDHPRVPGGWREFMA